MGCHLCPRECNADRANGEIGYCKEGALLRVGRAYLHKWEEPCICGKNGSGTVFFTGCPLQCVFCQNYAISDLSPSACGKNISSDRLAEIFLELQDQGACNINLVTPTHFVPQIIPALCKAKQEGLTLPIVYNTGGYEKIETLKALDGLIDIYLPDLKYVSSRLSTRFSNAPDYFEKASGAIAEMYRQVGSPVFDENTCLMQKGMIVRHLMLPKHLSDSKRVVSYLYDTYKDNIFISIMSQYTPVKQFPDMPELNRRVSRKEYNELVDYCISLGIENAYIQEGESAKESFIPDFNGDGV